MVAQLWVRTSDTHPLYGKVPRTVVRISRVDPRTKLIQLGNRCPWYSTGKLHLVVCVCVVSCIRIRVNGGQQRHVDNWKTVMYMYGGKRYQRIRINDRINHLTLRILVT